MTEQHYEILGKIVHKSMLYLMLEIQYSDWQKKFYFIYHQANMSFIFQYLVST